VTDGEVGEGWRARRTGARAAPGGLRMPRIYTAIIHLHIHMRISRAHATRLGALYLSLKDEPHLGSQIFEGGL